VVDRELVQAKLAELEERISRVRDRCPPSADVLSRDRDALDLVSFNLMLAIQSCADIASHIISDEGWPAARTLSEGFERLRDRGALTAPTTTGMRSAVVVRNIVAHGYSSADPAKIYLAATDGLDVLEAFAGEISQWVLGRASE